jgi:hypothetical protein
MLAPELINNNTALIDNGTVYLGRYRITDNIHIIFGNDEDNNNFVILVDADATWDHIMRDWDYGDLDKAQYLSGFGVGPSLDEATNADTEVRIWVTWHYYTNTLSRRYDNYLTDQDGDEIIFATHQEAAAWIEEEEAVPYVLDNNEYARPTYTIIN